MSEMFMNGAELTSLDDLLKRRKELEEMIVGSSVFSRRTDLEGRITMVEPKRIYLNFSCWQSIPFEFDKLDEFIRMEENIRKSIDDYKETFALERRLKRKKRM